MNICRNYCLILIAFCTLFTAIQAQETYRAPQLSHPDSWSIILVPDTQTYVKFERNQGTLETMTAWISENIDALNIKMVLCTGDLVEQNELLVSDKINGNMPSRNNGGPFPMPLSAWMGKYPIFWRQVTTILAIKVWRTENPITDSIFRSTETC